MAGGELKAVVSGGRYEVRLDSPIPELERPGAKAYEVQVVRGSGATYALLVHPHHLPRFEFYGQALNVNSPYVLRFLDNATVLNPDGGRRQAVIILERPGSAPAMAMPRDERPPIQGDVAFRQMAESLHDALRDMHLANVQHGSINPGNVFLREGGSQLQLGDYLATAPGVGQWQACETIERMMADPTGRGRPTPADDIYAMGVTLLALMMGRLPAAGLTDTELLEAKIEKGSMMALLNGAKLPSAFSEIFRGLLADDPRQRWGLEDVAHWLGGRRLGNKPAPGIKKAQRVMEFGGRGYIHLRSLAHAMSQNIDAASTLIEDSTLDKWLRRSLLDEELANAVQETVGGNSSITKGGSAHDRLVARVVTTLDPPGPMRMRDIAILPDGVGSRLAHQMLKREPIKALADIITSQMVTHWCNQQHDLTGSTEIQQTYEGARMLLERAMPGFGLERIAYELNPGLPCQSPMMERDYALTPKEVLEAIERVAAAGDLDGREPMDRHIAAFLLARLRKLNDRFFPLLSPGTLPGQRAVAILSILAEAQRKASVEAMPETAGWLATLLVPAMDRFHQIQLREKVMRDVRRAAKKGRLDDMLALLDDNSTINKDEDGFKKARQEYIHWENVARTLAGDPAVRQKSLMQQGRLLTSFIAIFAALVAISLSIFFVVM